MMSLDAIRRTTPARRKMAAIAAAVMIAFHGCSRNPASEPNAPDTPHQRAVDAIKARHGRVIVEAPGLAAGECRIDLALETVTNADLASLKDSLAAIDGLVSLGLANSQVDDDGLEILASCPLLRELDLSGTPVRGPGLVPLRSLASLQKLYFRDGLLETGRLAPLVDLPNLEHLDLSCPGLGDDDVAVVAKLPNLKRLELRGTKITDAAAESITQIVALESLDVGQTTLGDEGIAKFVALPKLTSLNIGGSRATEAAIEKLAKAPNLKELEMGALAPRDEVIVLLRTSCPGIKVYPHDARRPSAAGK